MLREVWGYHEYDTAEQLLRFSIKSIIGLPQSTPNYILYLKTDKEKLYLFLSITY